MLDRNDDDTVEFLDQFEEDGKNLELFLSINVLRSKIYSKRLEF